MEIVKKSVSKINVFHEPIEEEWEEDYEGIKSMLDKHNAGDIELDEEFVKEETAKLEDLKQKLRIK
jgi:hypothetical protein